MFIVLISAIENKNKFGSEKMAIFILSGWFFASENIKQRR